MNGPEGVKLHRADGTVLDVELFDAGVDDEGMHVWEVANAVYQLGDNLTVDVMPGRTSITFRASVPPEVRPTGFDIEWQDANKRPRKQFFKLQKGKKKKR